MSKKLKQLGMQNEFNDWLKNRNSELHAGDRIELVKLINVFPELDKGMKGTVKDINPYGIVIKFDGMGNAFTLNYIRDRYRRI